MSARELLIALGLLAAAPAAAQDGDDVRKDYLVQVRPGPPRHFYTEDAAGCPALAARCRTRAYVVAGDQLVAWREAGGFTRVTYASGKGRQQDGWIETAALARVAPPRARVANWLGRWFADEASIEIRAGKRPGWIHAAGQAFWGTHDKWRVAHGAINLGDFEADVAPRSDLVAIASGGADPSTAPFGEADAGCRLRMRLLGRFLVAQDNGRCGGLNVSFARVYRKR